MSILSDRWIRKQAQSNRMIEPFVENQRRDGCISYGLSSYGYDARVADEFPAPPTGLGSRRAGGFAQLYIASHGRSLPVA